MDIKGYTCIYIYININAKGNKKYTYKRNQKDVYVNGYKWIHIDSINELCSLTVLFFFAGHKGPWYQHRLRYHTGFMFYSSCSPGWHASSSENLLDFLDVPTRRIWFCFEKNVDWPPIDHQCVCTGKTQKSWDLFEVIYFQTKPDTNAIDPSRCERRFAHAQCTGNPRLQLRSILILFWAEPCAMVKIGTCPPARDSHSPYKHREEGF
jgi:hypothetical protein